MEACTCVDDDSYTSTELLQSAAAKEHTEHADTETSSVSDRQPGNANVVTVEGCEYSERECLVQVQVFRPESCTSNPRQDLHRVESATRDRSDKHQPGTGRPKPAMKQGTLIARTTPESQRTHLLDAFSVQPKDSARKTTAQAAHGATHTETSHQILHCRLTFLAGQNPNFPRLAPNKLTTAEYASGKFDFKNSARKTTVT